MEDLMDRIEEALNEEPYRPWCLHRLCEEVVATRIPRDRDGLLRLTEQLADQLAAEGRAQREPVSALSIGVHCQDSLYWSVKANQHHLEEFGPEYEVPTILHRLASHMYCHGL
ncbi:MAG: hypothetical protein L3K17_00060 [Thermoplasmata archaeon]|nr:hypothetical protein [Thermoplasmata archaeon]